MTDVFTRARQRAMDDALKALHSRGANLLAALQALAADRQAVVAEAAAMVAAGEYEASDLVVFRTAMLGTIASARGVLDDLETALTAL